MKIVMRIVALALMPVSVMLARVAPVSAQIAFYPAVAGAYYCPFQFMPVFAGWQDVFARSAIDCLINAERTSRGLPPLRYSSQLSLAAYQHLNEAVGLKWWGPNQNSHVNPVTGTTPQVRVWTTLYCFLPPLSFGAAKIGEITYTGAGGSHYPPNAAVNWWMNVSTSGHREIILDPEFTHFGIWASGQTADRQLEGISPAGTYVVVFGTCPMLW
jgi:uncharacterized protein YkwD